MLNFVLRRLMWVLPNIVLLTFLLFAVVTNWLGSPASMMLGTDASPEAVAELNARYGFDRPVVVQYLQWIGNAATGDFGRSYATRQPVAEMIGPAIPVTLELTFWTMLLAISATLVINSIPVGKHVVGALTTGISIVGVTVPNFLLGATLISIFSVSLGWLPTTGWRPWSDGIFTHLQHLILPVLTLSAYYFSTFSMIYRAEYRQVEQQLFVRVAEAKGISRRAVSFLHVLPNAILPLVVYIGTSIGNLVGGAVVTETVFSIPGLGRLFVSAIARYDFPVMLTMGMITLAGVMLMNLAAELILALLNPQIRL
ncbi:ABC transporter permease [Salipiger sp. P9]|uniref:ABC transporter permease n=1 Tax=Salipiger pentaromativorans TaxID=2943193 RepID=UPI0021588353|nr:ABC transporter permease [Salipiger pentaromativorans]MCR8549233.1 ABC transporter permease [Salipiger pentaromativorans]